MSFESPGLRAHRADAPPRASLSAEPRLSHGHGRGAPVPDAHHHRDTHLAAWFAKALGFGILALSALVVAALLTWSVADPSFSNPGMGLRPTNALGPIGAILSDIVIQSLGLASVFALLPPVFWAAQLLSRHGIDGARAKVVTAPVAVLCLAAFLSGLPKAAVWPLGSGYGGLLGDFGFQFVTGLFGIVNAERAPLVTGVCLMAAGFSLLMLSLGLTPADLKRIAERRRTHVPDSAWVSHLMATGVTSTSDEDVLSAGLAPQPAAHAAHHAAQARDLNQPTPETVRAPVMTVAAPVLAPPPVAPVAPVSPPAPELRPVAAPQATAAPARPVSVTRPAPQPAAQSGALASAPPRLSYRRPPLTLLPQSTAPRSNGRDLHVAEKLRAGKLIQVLETYGVRAEVTGQLVGPVVTTFTVEPAAGTRSSRLIGLADDIARGLGVACVRIQSSAARSAVQIEIPHEDPVCMGLRDFIAHDSYHAGGHILPLVIGASAVGEPCVVDLANAAVLIAGQDRSTRDALVNTAVTSLVFRHAPTTLRFVFIGTRGDAFERWAALPHLAVPPAIDMANATDLLTWAAAEIDARTLRLRAMAQAQTIEAYNQRLRTMAAADTAPMPHLALVLADLAELLRDGNQAKLSALNAILRRGKAAGVHIIAATASADEQALPPGLVAAFSVRLAAQVASKAESRFVLGEAGAEDLPSGDVLMFAGGGSASKSLGAGVHRLHAALIRAPEAAAIAATAAKPGEPVAELGSQPMAGAGASPARELQQTLQQTWDAPASDSLYDRAVDVVRRSQSADASVLKRDLSLTSGMAIELLDQMARDGILSAPDAGGQRRVLLGRAA